MGERARFGGVAERLGRGLGRHRGPCAGGLISPEGSKLVEAAAAAAAGQQYPAAALYVVATPIGNLADLTLRALHVLAIVDAVACEDTRHSAALLRHFAITKPLIAVHEHNERSAAGVVLARLARGERVAYVSDAGTPAVSDPGAELVAAVHAAGHRVVPIPGASSALAALSAAGDAGAQAFVVVGFLPARGSERERSVAEIAHARATQIVFEAPHRIESLAAALASACPDRSLTLCRELTKQFETIVTMTAGALRPWLAADPNRARGEFVLVLHALRAADAVLADSAHDAVLMPLLAALPLKQAVALAGEITGAARNALYARALVLKERGTPTGALR
jgi:16S rRNA (cytidine1402-2'-O)-methyltransferase